MPLTKVVGQKQVELQFLDRSITEGGMIMTIYAIKASTDTENVSRVFRSLKAGEGR